MGHATLKGYIWDLRKACDWLLLHAHLLTPEALEQTRRDYQRTEQMLSALSLREMMGGVFG